MPARTIAVLGLVPALPPQALGVPVRVVNNHVVVDVTLNGAAAAGISAVLPPAVSAIVERPAVTCVALLIARPGVLARRADLQLGDYL